MRLHTDSIGAVGKLHYEISTERGVGRATGTEREVDGANASNYESCWWQRHAPRRSCRRPASLILVVSDPSIETATVPTGL